MATDDSLSEILYPQWQNEYAAALLETDPQRLSERVEAAETGIYKQLQQLSQNSDHHTEKNVIEDSLETPTRRACCSMNRLRTRCRSTLVILQPSQGLIVTSNSRVYFCARNCKRESSGQRQS
jgi:hypothetical protein